MDSNFPVLYQINTRVLLTELSGKLGRQATLDDIPDELLDSLVEQGFDWVWFLSVWQTGAAGQRISRTDPNWRKEFEETLPDLTDDDIGGSGFAIVDYVVDRRFGGDEALARLRERLAGLGVKLMLDFVPNHTAIDNRWVSEHPEYYIQGTRDDLQHAPQNYTLLAHGRDARVFAYGRDPYFPGWQDTLQLDYSNPDTQEAMMRELLKISGQCDGVRCDMAMLVLPDVFERTWGKAARPFWSLAVKRVRQDHPNFCFMAEVYWDMEWRLQEQGFDYTYDKRLYDRLRQGQAKPVRDHMRASMDYQVRLARFLENHDEPRVAATFSLDVHKAAAVITFLAPGLRLFHQGQFEGKLKRISPHLVRGPQEPVNEEIKHFYDRLLSTLKLPVIHHGEWQLLECSPAWEGNWTNDCFISYLWQQDEYFVLSAVNYSDHQSQCFVQLPLPDVGLGKLRLQDQLSGAVYDREVFDLITRGLYLDMQPWQSHVFVIGKCQSAPDLTTSKKGVVCAV